MQHAIVSKQDRVNLFKKLTEEFSEMAAKEGVVVTAYSGSGPEFFSGLSESVQASTLAHFEAYVDVARSVQGQGESLQNDLIFLWRMFQRLKAHPSSDFMSSLKSGEVVEIHNAEFVQIFRNLEFFKLCSYTLDDLLCRPFWELYERDDSIANRLIEIAGGLFSARGSGAQVLDIPEHTVLEIDSPGRLFVRVQHRIASAVSLSDGTPVAVVAAIKADSCVRTAGLQDLEMKHGRYRQD